MNLQRLFRDQLSFLAFKGVPKDFTEHRSAYLEWGLAITWLAGLGRY